MMMLLHPSQPRAGERATRWDALCREVPAPRRRLTRPGIPACLADGWLTRPGIPACLADGWLTCLGIPACLADGWLTRLGIPACLADGWLTCLGIPACLASGWLTCLGSPFHPYYENIEIRLWRNLG
jgi:hypothetical protein